MAPILIAAVLSGLPGKAPGDGGRFTATLLSQGYGCM